MTNPLVALLARHKYFGGATLALPVDGSFRDSAQAVTVEVRLDEICLCHPNELKCMAYSRLRRVKGVVFIYGSVAT